MYDISTIIDTKNTDSLLKFSMDFNRVQDKLFVLELFHLH